MVMILKSPLDEYKDLYEKEKLQNKYNEMVIKYAEKEIERLEKENKAYKVLLKRRLDEEISKGEE